MFLCFALNIVPNFFYLPVTIDVFSKVLIVRHKQRAPTVFPGATVTEVKCFTDHHIYEAPKQIYTSKLFSHDA